MNNLFKLITEFDGQPTLPTFDDVVGMEDLKSTLRMAIIEPLKDPAMFANMGLKAGGKFILFGPPGTGKTFISMAIAGEAKASCFRMSPANTWGSQFDKPEAEVAKLFDRARAEAPSVINVDEVETLIVDRSKYENSPWHQIVLNEMLIQLDDGANNNEGILLMGSTNSPWSIDIAAMRHGRFEQVIFLPPPDRASRADFFKKRFTSKNLNDADFQQLAEASANFTFADIEGALKRTKVAFLHDRIKKKLPTTEADYAIDKERLIKEFGSQPNSASSWFKQFQRHGDDLPKPMVDAVAQYRAASRGKEA